MLGKEYPRYRTIADDVGLAHFNVELSHEAHMKTLLVLLGMAALLALASPQSSTAQSSACNPQVQTCL